MKKFFLKESSFKERFYKTQIIPEGYYYLGVRDHNGSKNYGAFDSDKNYISRYEGSSLNGITVMKEIIKQYSLNINCRDENDLPKRSNKLALEIMRSLK